LLERERKRFALLLTHERPISGIQAAFEMCESYADGVGKMTIRL
jgi:hypothetical protein